MAGDYESRTVNLNRQFALENTSTLATPDNIADVTIRPAGLITIATDIENGTVAADKDVCNFFTGNRTVTLTVTPHEKYKLENLSVTLAQDGGTAQGMPSIRRASREISVVKVDDTTYTFEMPDGDVTVSASFTSSEVTAIDRIDADRVSNAARYNINGQRLQDSALATTTAASSLRTAASECRSKSNPNRAGNWCSRCSRARYRGADGL